MPANPFNAFTDYGIGIGLRVPHYRHILAKKPVVDWFEIISENFMVDGGRPLEVLDQILEQYRVVQHGVAMYFGSADKLNREHLKRLKRLVKRTNTPWLSDHLCWGSVDGRYTHDLLPMPYTFAAARVTADKIRQARDYLEVPICVENVSSYAEFHASEMTEWEFLSEVVELADCGILLDVNNIYVSSRNHNFNPYDYLNNIPHHRVGQIHIAGHSKFKKYILDTHDHPVLDPVWEMYAHAIRKVGHTATLLEWDDRIPSFDEVHNEALKAASTGAWIGSWNTSGRSSVFCGKPYAPGHPLDARNAGVSMIYQELSLAKHLTVMENIVLGMEPTAGPFVKWKEFSRRAIEAMKQLGRTDILPDTPVHKLSIASQQLVEIGRAIAVGARVLVLDEPTSSLARNDIERLFELVRRLRQQGLGIVYISHFLEEVRALCDRFTVLRDGKSVSTGEVASTPNEQIIAMMVGRSVADLYPRSDRTQGEAVLELDSLAGPIKPESASLTLHRGEVLGIAGLVGAGRTELLRTIFGLDAVKSGKIKIKAYVGSASPAERWSRGVGMVSEDRKQEGLALSLSIADNLTLSSLGSIVKPSAQAETSKEWIKKLAIRCREPQQPVGNLSGGNQQKVAIARLLVHGVDVLLLDEPTRGIDVGSKAQIYKLIDELACSGKAILMVSSYLPELLGTCDRIAVMCKGYLHPARNVTDIDEHMIMIEATDIKEAA